MAAKLHKHAQRTKEFPALTHLNHKITSPVDLSYNCIAWALDDTTRWWWPDAMGVRFWPPNIARQETIAAFEEMLQQQGYSRCLRRTVERGLEKVALFVRAGVPKHLAKQTTKGKWSSKLGEVEDIEHSLDALDGPEYGAVHQVYSRPVQE